jgi:hypothetical protein
MGEYDAFGRKKGEDTMSDLGWGATGQAPPPVERPATPDVSISNSSPSPSADWSPAQPSPIAPSGPRRRGRNPMVWLIQLLVLGGLAAGIYFAVDSGKDAVDKVRDSFNTFTVPDSNSNSGTPNIAPPEDPEGSTPPQQVAPRKVFTAQGLKESLKIMERETPGKLQNFTMRPDSISYQVQHGRKWQLASLDSDAEIPDITTTQERAPADTGIAYGQIDPGAPARLIRGAGARLNKARSDVDYLVLQDIGTVRWIVYFKAANGGPARYAIGDAKGRVAQVY